MHIFRALCVFTILFSLCVAAEKSNRASMMETLLDEAAKTSTDEFLGLTDVLDQTEVQYEGDLYTVIHGPNAGFCIIGGNQGNYVKAANPNYPNNLDQCLKACHDAECKYVSFRDDSNGDCILAQVDTECLGVTGGEWGKGYDYYTTYQRSTPTPAPTRTPTLAPTRAPTPTPTRDPTPAPTADPTPAPTADPTPTPTAKPTVASASWSVDKNDKQQANRDAGMDVMNSCNGGNTFFRWRTGTATHFKVTLKLTQTTTLRAVDMTVNDPANEDASTAGYSGIRILIGPADSGTEVYNSEKMYGTTEDPSHTAFTDTDGTNFIFGQPTRHTLTSVQSNVQEVTIEFRNAYQKRDYCVSFNSIDLIA